VTASGQARPSVAQALAGDAVAAVVKPNVSTVVIGV
jgi:hypothetical protein